MGTLTDFLQIPLTTSFCIHFSTFPILNVAVDGKHNSAGTVVRKKYERQVIGRRGSEKT
jgi:hypothetical protein